MSLCKSSSCQLNEAIVLVLRKDHKSKAKSYVNLKIQSKVASRDDRSWNTGENGDRD